jgi:chromosome segregation ATPase
MFFLVGFFAASLLCLLAVPAISRRARRLAAARERLQAPLSETQARAERDALRAQHAVEMVRLERRLSAAEDVSALQRVEVGRQASQIIALDDLSAERAAEIARQRGELAAIGAEARDLNVQRATQEMALRDLTAQRDDAQRDFALARLRIAELEMLVDENRAVAASLEAQVTSLHVENADLRRAAIAAESERVRSTAALQERMSAANRLMQQLEAAEARHASLALEFEGSLAEGSRLRARLAAIEPRLARSEASREEIMLEAGRQLVQLAERDVALDRTESARRDLASRLVAEAETASAKQEALASQNQALSTSHATMDGALRALRSERADLQREIDRLRSRLAESAQAAQTVAKGDQALRQSIARLGREIARGQPSPADEEGTLAGQIVNFARREPNATTIYPADPSGTPAHRQDQPIASEG